MQLSYLNQIITVNYSWTLCFFNLSFITFVQLQLKWICVARCLIGIIRKSLIVLFVCGINLDLMCFCVLLYSTHVFPMQA